MSEKPKKQGTLCATAEAKPAQAPKPKQKALSAEELLHELEAHQIKLEIQNEELRRAQVELEKSRDRYVDFYDFAPVGYLTLNSEEMIDEINLTGATLLGVERNKLLHRRFDTFVAAEDRDCWNHHFLAALTHDGTLTCDLALRRGDGSSFYVRLDSLKAPQGFLHPEDAGDSSCAGGIEKSPRLPPGKAGKATRVRIALADITERKRMENTLREQKEFFRMIAENVEDFIAVVDLEGRRIYNNPSYARLFGNVEDLKGKDSFAEIHPDDRERVRHLFGETVRTGAGMRAEFRFVLATGGIRYMESCGGLIKNSHGEALRVVVVSHDITARKQYEDEIHNLAFYDSLTKLPNRRLLNDRLVQAMATSKRSSLYGALMFLDLDNFKSLNDAYGHNVGDLLLVEVAHRIGSCVRGMDTVARFGGDEFVVVLSELGVDKAESATQTGIIAEKIRAALAEPYALKIRSEGKAETAVEHHCTSSIGVMLFVNHEARTEEILKWADIAMYQAKEAGGNLIRFYDAKP